MNKWATAPSAEREALFTETAARTGISAEIIEKDFWVCWMLYQIFAMTDVPRVIFKGGTSLSKAFGMIKRFSEDIDLVLNRHELGFDAGKDPANQEGTNLRKRTVEELKAACVAYMNDEFIPRLSKAIASVLGDAGWTLTADENAPDHDTFDFTYPRGLPDPVRPGYVRRVVRLELGCRGDQIPCEEARVVPYTAERFPDQFEIKHASVSVLAAERTFWEKATLLHREYYRFEAGKGVTARVFRHYDDLVNMWKHDRGRVAVTKLELLSQVTTHKSIFFREAAAHYELAIPGSLRLAPTEGQEAEIRKDYEQTKEMYFGDVPDFDEVMTGIRRLEQDINGAQMATAAAQIDTPAQEDN
ncbi:MAG TPA: nucleotidyl transferase AbiEii/AbiGii toxin family protein [Terriglobales bacterium]|jgi:hypothetical protein